MTPLELASKYLRLPPILYISYLVSISSYSKAPWGLAVLSQVTTNHYAFRAGQNLPDKEFRYLRTVIVTAAVHWGLISKLRILKTLTFPLDLPALGRRQLLYFIFRFCRNLCFC